MPRLTLIYPCIGRFPGDKYVRSWQMQPLAMAVLAGLTPKEWDITFFDDRLEEIDFDMPTDLVGISVEAYTSKRGYQIAAKYREKGIPVVIGGYHATLCPDEVKEHADAVCLGEAEWVWEKLLEDAKAGQLKSFYDGQGRTEIYGIKPDHSIFKGKNYFSIALVETGRGCPFNCDFCSITALHKGTYRRRPIPEIVAELKSLNEKFVFFVDDNVIGDMKNARELFAALKPLGIKWVSQASINAAKDPEFLKEMVESGCTGLLIGFESLDPGNLDAMGKKVNRPEDFSEALGNLRKAGIAIYATFVFGYPNDTPEIFRQTVEFARKEKIFMIAFNHMVPFPGTPLYRKIEEEGRLRYPKWWLDEEFRFGQVPFNPPSMSYAEIEEHCHHSRKAFYSVPSILERGLEFKANCKNWEMTKVFYGLNFLLRHEVTQKRGIPLGMRDGR